jgi:Galactose-1-phosphate uridyltransferase
MSSQLTVYIHKIGEPIKENEEDGSINMINIFWLSTTPTRELYDCISATYNGDTEDLPIYGKYHRVLTSEMLKDIDDFYKGQIKSLREIVDKSKEEIKTNNDIIAKATSIDVVHDLKEENKETAEYISDSEQSIERYDWLSTHFAWAKEMVDSNNDYKKDNPVYELVYSMD